jgi:IS5 family transposase
VPLQSDDRADPRGNGPESSTRNGSPGLANREIRRVRWQNGYDANKKLTLRKQHIVTDSLGLLLAAVVTIASVQDAAGASQVLAEPAVRNIPRLQVVYADSAYHRQELQTELKATKAQF